MIIHQSVFDTWQFVKYYFFNGGYMPIEVELLKSAQWKFSYCPKCNMPFTPFMRGQVHRSKWWFKNYCAVICSNCKQIVDWESPPRKQRDYDPVIYFAFGAFFVIILFLIFINLL